MKLTPAAATSTCTSPSAGSGNSWARTCRTLRSTGSVTKTLVARFMLATLRPVPPTPRAGAPRGTDAHEQGHLVLQRREKGVGIGHDRLVGHDADPHGAVVGDDAEAECVASGARHPPQHAGHRHAREVALLPGPGDVGRDADRLVGEEVHDSTLEHPRRPAEDG